MIFYEPQKRDRTLFPHDPFKALADGAEIASKRLWK